VVINLPKLKTHNLTALTVAVKNLFGLVPGALKIGYHSKLQERARFCHAMLDILTYVKPALNIVDAIVGMEGEGPSGGDPREIGAIIASADALATDVVAAGLVGFDPLDVLTTRVAVERGLTDGRLESLELLGDPLETLRCAGFRRGIEAPLDPGLFPKTLRWLVTLGMSSQDSGSTEGEPDAHGRGLFRPLASGWVWRQLVAVPSAGPKCIGCGFCVSHCPVDAITLADGIAHMDRKTCIRCYCCHELCPHTAVELSKPWLGRLLMGS
jgi:ferredoxin